MKTENLLKLHQRNSHKRSGMEDLEMEGTLEKQTNAISAGEDLK